MAMAARILARRTTLASSTLMPNPCRILNPCSSSSRSSSSPPASDGVGKLHSFASAGDLGWYPLSDLRSMASRSFPAPDHHRLPSPVIDGGRVLLDVVIPKIGNYGLYSASQPYKSSCASMQAFPRWYSVKPQARAITEQICNISSQLDHPTERDSFDVPHNLSSRVVSFSPLETSIGVKERPSSLRSECLKIKRIELSQKITYALIPALLLISKTKLTTSMLILSVLWQVYGFFKEIFLDYVHQEVTRKWVLIYFKLLLLIVAKDLLLAFSMG